ncbi:pleiotropic drug resistance 2 [Actinidia rufa]|uniref:Pleiotropic drug resistance 2 n=1 Tax=Actinidia rufa TaxID=165716 RepID=A0A7J0H8C6_9ERIC|nr:pleiotropic drug resistance 2 [Actinidia rufa]
MSWLWAYCYGLYEQKENQEKQGFDCVTWSDSEKEEESDSGDEIENYTAFMTSVVKTNKTSSKASDTEKSDESDGVVGSIEEESDDEDISELQQQAYNQLYKELYKLANSNVKLSKRLKEALEEVDSLKKMNDDTQVEISQLKNHHRTILIDKVRFLDKDAFDREGFKKALEDKVQKLETELVNVHLSFTKFDASSQKIDEIWNAQRTSFDMTRIGYKEKATTSSQLTSKPYSTKAQGTSSMPNIEIMPTKFVPKCHQCGVKGHIRSHCPRLETKHVHAQFITSHVKPKHPKLEVWWEELKFRARSTPLPADSFFKSENGSQNDYMTSWQGIPGVPKIHENYNLATWMLEVTSPSAEAKLGIDFAHIYEESHHSVSGNQGTSKETELPCTSCLSRRNEAPAPNRVENGVQTRPHALPEYRRVRSVSITRPGRCHALPRARGSTHAPARAREKATRAATCQERCPRSERRAHAPTRSAHAPEEVKLTHARAHERERKGDAPARLPLRAHLVPEIFDFDILALSEVSQHSGFIRGEGHIKRDCPKYKAQDQSSDTAATAMIAVDEDEIDVLLAASDDGKSDWILDSSSAYHLCRDREVFSTYVPCEGRIWMANNTSSRVVRRGSVRFRMTDESFDASGRTLRVFKGNKEMLWGKKTGKLYRLEGSVQTGGATVRHGSSGISKKNEQGKQPLHRGTQSKCRGTWRIRSSTRAQGDALGYVRKYGQTRVVQPVQDVHRKVQRKETKSILRSCTAKGTTTPKRVSFALDLISGGDLSSCVHKGGEMEPRQLANGKWSSLLMRLRYLGCCLAVLWGSWIRSCQEGQLEDIGLPSSGLEVEIIESNPSG